MKTFKTFLKYFLILGLSYSCAAMTPEQQQPVQQEQILQTLKQQQEKIDQLGEMVNKHQNFLKDVPGFRYSILTTEEQIEAQREADRKQAKMLVTIWGIPIVIGFVAMLAKKLSTSLAA